MTSPEALRVSTPQPHRCGVGEALSHAIGRPALACPGTPNETLSDPCCRHCLRSQQPIACRDRLYAEFTQLVRRLMRQYAGDDREMREDLSGEIYLRFSRLLDAYLPERGIPLRPYMVRQLMASTYTFARREWRGRRRQLSLEQITGNAEPWELEDPTKDWDSAIEQKWVQKLLPHAIASLPTRQRAVVILRHFEQRPYDEIASQLGVQEATARSLARHGINGMRKWMQRNYPEHI